jgi:hypothetical protein
MKDNMKDGTKGIIYYSPADSKRKLFRVVRDQIERSGLPITSCTLRPLNFGNNIVINEPRGATAMFKQILTALENAKEKYVFFCEHDVLYSPTHFEFTPPRDDTFYYNTNVWRWNTITNKVTTYDHLVSVSGLCVNRELAIEFYRHRINLIYEKGYDKVPTHGNPGWARDMGYEPGKIKADNLPAKIEEWKSTLPNLDIRHTRNLTPSKTSLESFRRKPTNWRESTVDTIPGMQAIWPLTLQ